ncbi:MAG: hypothetical protein IJW46_01645 [Clostridia bacterium]|nr:hypothetical protein [Clostridia bacterium]
MLNSLDLLVIVFMGLIALTLFSLALLFFLRNKKAKKVFFYITIALAVYLSTVAFRISSGLFFVQTVLSFVTAGAAIAALVLERVSKGNEKLFLLARIISSCALILALLNAIL